MTNKFFNIALQKAAALAGKKGRLIMLLTKLGTKVGSVNWKAADPKLVRDKVMVLGRMVRAYATGEYRGIPWKTFLLIVAAIIYFINPIDLIPDLIPLTGFTDDFGILLWVYSTLGNEVDKFIAWEKTRTIAI